MAEAYREKRKHVRVYFSPNEEVQGGFAIPGQGQAHFFAPLLDLSLGGLNFSLTREEGAAALQVGSSLVLSELRQGGRLLSDQEVPVRVRWVVTHPFLDHVSFGCEFQELGGPGRQLLEGFVAERLRAGRDRA